ncbi:MAG: P-loop NTPase [Nitrospirae bacterium]|nr:P-loop NTPase [Nitrospirota bacterium]MBF0542161.1 P-loop NTPase [Nitrospirota bacterium]
MTTDNQKIIAVFGPKGGVGKSTITANLAIAIAEMGKKVIAVDLDLGASNLHAIFGVRDTRHSLEDFTMKKVKELSDCVTDTNIDNLGIICGGDVPGIANMPYQQKVKLINNLSTLDCDVIVLDLAAGVSNNVIDFLFIADTSLLVTTPEITSLLNVYSFIKTSVFRRLNFHFKALKSIELLELLEKAKDSIENPSLATMNGFLEAAAIIDQRASESAKKVLTKFKPYIVINRIKTPNDANVGTVITDLMQRYINILTSVIITIHEDQCVGKALSMLKPVMIAKPSCAFSLDVKEAAYKIMD